MWRRMRKSWFVMVQLFNTQVIYCSVSLIFQAIWISIVDTLSNALEKLGQTLHHGSFLHQNWLIWCSPLDYELVYKNALVSFLLFVYMQCIYLLIFVWSILHNDINLELDSVITYMASVYLLVYRLKSLKQTSNKWWIGPLTCTQSLSYPFPHHYILSPPHINSKLHSFFSYIFMMVFEVTLEHQLCFSTYQSLFSSIHSWPISFSGHLAFVQQCPTRAPKQMANWMVGFASRPTRIFSRSACLLSMWNPTRT